MKPGAAAQENDEAHKRAMDVRAQAVLPKADFAELARKNSQERISGANGGDIGWRPETDMTQAERETITGMADGAVSQPVRLPDGWHVVKVLESRPAGQLSLLDAKQNIVRVLRDARTKQAIEAYLDSMKKAQSLDINEDELAKEVSAGK